MTAAKRSTRRGTGKRAPEKETTRQPTPARQYVDIDPWAMLLEGLMAMPEEEPVERARPKKK